MKDLITELGISRDTLEFMNVQDLQRKRENLLTQPSDSNFNYLMNALFTPLDMTDYEDTFVGFNEVGGSLPISGIQYLKPVIEEPWPMNHSLMALETSEARPMLARNRIHKELLEGKAVEEEEEDEEEGGEEEEGEGEEGEGEEAAEEAEEEEGEAPPEEEAWPPKQQIAHADLEDKYFLRGEKLRNKFNEIELDSFMKLLNVKPHRQWQDTSYYHYKLGVHTYEDDSQHLDPYYHILGEVERKHVEKIMVEEFRKGTEVKFEFAERRPAHVNYRF